MNGKAQAPGELLNDRANGGETAAASLAPSALTGSPAGIDPFLPRAQGLYNPAKEHDSCGVGFVADMRNRKSHDILQKGLQILVNLDHRGATGADVKLGDGCGVLAQIPHGFFVPGMRQARHDFAGRGSLRDRSVLHAARAFGARRRRDHRRGGRLRRVRPSSAGATCRPTIPTSAKG